MSPGGSGSASRARLPGLGVMNPAKRKASAPAQLPPWLLALVPSGQVASVQVVTGSYDLAQSYAGDKRPVSERVRATCPVARRA